MNSTVTGYLMVALGILVMLGAAMNWRIITRSGKMMNMLLGDKIARVVYFVLGIFFLLLGINQLTGLDWF